MSTGIAADRGFDFGTAIAFMRRGIRVQRAGWNGKGMWLVLIHPGNAPSDSEGCILVGTYNPEKPDWISNSRTAYNELFKRLTEIAAFGPMSISIRGGRYDNEAVA